MNTKYLLQRYIKEIEIEDLDIENIGNIFGQHFLNDIDNSYKSIVDIQSDGYWHRESEQINIDTLINALNALKENGANYVEIMHHDDHHGYVLNAVVMREATKGEVDEYKEALAQKEQETREAKIAKLEAEIDKLKKQ